MNIKRIKEILTMPKEERLPLIQVPPENLLKTGYTPLDVHLSGGTKGGYGKGLFIYIVGDTSTCKTGLSNTCLAEACMNPAFDDYDLIFDNVENGNLFDLIYFFGKRVKKRWEPPKGTQEAPIYSRTSQEFFYNLDRRIKQKPCIYIIDSETALVPEQSRERFEENRKLRDKGKKEKSSYGMEKARENSDKMRMMVPEIEKSGSILIMIGQTRQNIGWGFEDRTKAGGLALSFYAHIELWTKRLKKFKTEIRGKERHIGTNIEIDIRKNRLTGWVGKVGMPYYFAHGIDNMGGCVDYLISEGHWKKKKGFIHAEELELTMKKEALIRKIEEDGSEGIVRKAVENCFRTIERLKKKAIHRKRRYE